MLKIQNPTQNLGQQFRNVQVLAVFKYSCSFLNEELYSLASGGRPWAPRLQWTWGSLLLAWGPTATFIAWNDVSNRAMVCPVPLSPDENLLVDHSQGAPVADKHG